MKNWQIILLSLLSIGCSKAEKVIDLDWPVYGGNKAGNRYSPLDQINLDNVKDLKVAWTYRAAAPDNESQKGIQCQPIVVDGVLFGTGVELKLFAIDAATGEELWVFDPKVESLKNRGIVYWEQGEDKRILYSVGPNLYAVNAKNGKKINGFANDGVLDLHIGLSNNQDKDISKLGIASSSPGAVYKNILIMGSSMTEAGNAPPGHIRGIDIVTGKLKWVFNTIPQPGELGYETWPKNAYKEVGGANNWSGLVVDEKRGLVYLGTGSPSSDFYGGNRKGQNLFANCVLAIEAETGKLRWYYQTIHHDLWDRDLPSPPNLTTITHNGKKLDVAVQATKDGVLYVLDRDTGESIFPVEERSVPTDGLPGEHPYPTQKYPLKPAPFSRQVFTDDDITNISPEAHDYIKELVGNFEYDNKFTPPSTKGTLLFGYSGGAEWGGNAIDQEGVLYQNSNEEAWLLQMTDTETRDRQIAKKNSGKELYEITCSSCHGMDRKGNGSSFPDISTVEKRFSKSIVQDIIMKGRGLMPSFQHLSHKERRMIVDYVFDPNAVMKKDVYKEKNAEEAKNDSSSENFGFKPKYVSKIWKRLVDQDGYPGIKPPWGTLSAINLNTGDYLWKVPLGEYSELTEKRIPITGTANYGGPVVTEGGLVFIAGTKDELIRAFNKKTGEVVWEYQLPAGGFATPITYQVNGKQYVVIAAGGGRGQKPGGDYIAFTLP